MAHDQSEQIRHFTWVTIHFSLADRARAIVPIAQDAMWETRCIWSLNAQLLHIFVGHMLTSVEMPMTL